MIACAGKISQTGKLRVFISSEDGTHSIVRAGVDEVTVFRSADGRAESCVEALSALAQTERPLAILFESSCSGKEIAARCAAILGTGLVTDALDIRNNEGIIETDRMVYGGLAIATEALSSPSLITLAASLYTPAAALGAADASLRIQEADGGSAINIVDRLPIERASVDLTKADKIVCVGRGVGKKDDLNLIYEMAAALGAEVSCTRAINEYQWFPPESYIGISGFKVRPSLYIAIGVSGQIQHLSGIRDSKTVVAVNNSESAPIFASADYGIVGDLYDFVPCMITALRKN
ncbi:MAG: electron transfer flavoprotein subunit alpha/FixB family protein [Gracilibacteraceae bacterium]|nr:electron transfer flavoprotein subunit alpha/FixB family protein [Gracilibacteraceae bacterium]